MMQLTFKFLADRSPSLGGQITFISRFGPKMLSGVRNREDPVFRVFYHIKNRSEKNGADEIGFMGIPILRGSGLEGLYCGLTSCKSLT